MHGDEQSWASRLLISVISRHWHAAVLGRKSDDQRDTRGARRGPSMMPRLIFVAGRSGAPTLGAARIIADFSLYLRLRYAPAATSRRQSLPAV